MLRGPPFLTHTQIHPRPRQEAAAQAAAQSEAANAAMAAQLAVKLDPYAATQHGGLRWRLFHRAQRAC
jgi:hypothetical protein